MVILIFDIANGQRRLKIRTPGYVERSKEQNNHRSPFGYHCSRLVPSLTILFRPTIVAFKCPFHIKGFTSFPRPLKHTSFNTQPSLITLHNKQNTLHHGASLFFASNYCSCRSCLHCPSLRHWLQRATLHPWSVWPVLVSFEYNNQNLGCSWKPLLISLFLLSLSFPLLPLTP